MAKTILGRVVNYKRLGAYLRRLREGQGWSQERLRREIARSKASISGWENGAHMGEDSLKLIAEVYRTDPETILRESGALEGYQAPASRPVWVEVVPFVMTLCEHCGQSIPIATAEMEAVWTEKRVLCCHCRRWSQIDQEIPDLSRYQAALGDQMQALNQVLGLTLDTQP